MIAKSPDYHALEQGRETVSALFAAALSAVEPNRAVRAAIGFCDGMMVVGGSSIDVTHGLHIVAIGKAAVAMARGVVEALPGVVISGDVITVEGHESGTLPESIQVHEAGHPIPDLRGLRATQEMLRCLGMLGPDAVVLALISGGGSALMEATREGISLTDLATTTDLLLRAGAPIDVLNAVRAPLSKVKSGGLRAAVPSAAWVTLILSDVLGNDPRIIASGPTVRGETNSEMALSHIDRYALRDRLPKNVLQILVKGEDERTEVHVEEDILSIIGDNAMAIEAAASTAQSLGLNATIAWKAMQGEAAFLGREFVSLVTEASDAIVVVLGGGEATVTVRGVGRGGRNTEFALAAALELERRRAYGWVVASLGTDGQDAMTGLAGAIADGGTADRARRQGVDPECALHQNDSATVFDLAGGTVKTGPTGTNVNDLYIAVRIPERNEDISQGGN